MRTWPPRPVHLDWPMPTCSTRSSGRSSWLWQSSLASARCLAGNSRSPRRASPQRRNGCSRSFFSRVNRLGAPVTGMIVLGVVQSLLALSTISPTLSEQFAALVNLAVVTNVLPYIISLSALMVMMKADSVTGNQVPAQLGRGAGGNALQHLRALRFGQGRSSWAACWPPRSPSSSGASSRHVSLQLEALSQTPAPDRAKAA